MLNGATGDVACNHYHLYREDVALLKKLGVDSYRFSLAWPRILPRGRGRVNQKGLDFYKRLLAELEAAKIHSAATLYHWDLPQALEDEGGWLNRDTAKYFADYAALVFEELEDYVDLWITLNEPWCSAYLGYGSGEHAPGKRGLPNYFRAAHHLLLAHGLSLAVYRELGSAADIGITLNLIPQYAAGASAPDRKAAEAADCFQNRWYLEPILKGAYPQDVPEYLKLVSGHIEPGDLSIIGQPLDFLGVNYYSRGIIKAAEGRLFESCRPQGPVTEMGWEIYPQGLYDLLMRLKNDYGPIPLYITENGAAFKDELVDGRILDQARAAYLKEHFAQGARAIKDGVNLRGYYVWSLLDNFEWSFGYERRFGLIYVDFKTQARVLKDSALWYRSFLEKRS